MKSATWKAFELESLMERQRDSKSPYLEFLRVPALSCGVYSLRPTRTAVYSS